MAPAHPGAAPHGLIGAACSAIDKKRDGTKVLAELRRYTVGDKSAALPANVANAASTVITTTPQADQAIEAEI